MLIKDFQKILFQGDSITDAGRMRIGNDLGVGYVFISTAWLRKLHPELKLEIINRGVSGNTVIDLKNRWEEDCIILKPDWLSILVGINDCYNNISEEEYEKTYTELILLVKQNVPSVNIVLMEPFLLEVKPEQKNLIKSIENKCEIVRSLAKKFDTLFIPLYEIFKQLLKIAAADYWTFDGIHPTPQGHFVIAENWLKTLGVL